MRRYLCSILLVLIASFLPAILIPPVAQAATLPPPPARYFNDFASVIQPQTAARLNQQLEAFERQTSNQIVVAIYPKSPEDVNLDTYSQDIYRSWKVGQQNRDNGVIFFVFVQDRKMRIQTGQGLEGALPESVIKRIIADEVAPHFQAGDFDAGLTAGVNAIIAATKVAYKGTGKTAAETTTWQQLKQESDQDWLLRISEGDHARAALLYQIWGNTPSSLHQMHLTQLLDAGKDLGAPKEDLDVILKQIINR